MRKGDYLTYERFERLEDNCVLAKAFNKIFEMLNIIRMTSAPTLFEDESKTDHYTGIIECFYLTCLFEVYAFDVVRRLREWQAINDIYLKKYEGSWEYYARCKRIDSINKYGGNDDDYNPDDSIKTDVSNEELFHYSIITDLVPDDHRDIFSNTTESDIIQLAELIKHSGGITIKEVIKMAGMGDIKTYRESKGVMIENTPEDEALNRLSKEITAETASSFLITIVSVISNIVKQVKSLPKDQDNKEFFISLTSRLQNILNVEIDEEVKIISEMYKGLKVPF